MVNLIYPSATVLLDLTASELCIERVAILMKQTNLYPIIMEGARQILFTQNPQPHQTSRLRDLLIGILLNLTCNVENQDLNKNLIDLGVVKLLNKILTDERNDWPSNGSALALLQYCHLGVSDADVFKHLEGASTFETIQGYLQKAKNPETRRHLHEALNLYQIGFEKKKSIERILETRFFVPCA